MAAAMRPVMLSVLRLSILCQISYWEHIQEVVEVWPVVRTKNDKERLASEIDGYRRCRDQLKLPYCHQQLDSERTNWVIWHLD
jgi:hypothetical protein